MTFINLTLGSRGKYDVAILGGTFRLELGAKRIKMDLRIRHGTV
jgi:hypothetical protein